MKKLVVGCVLGAVLAVGVLPSSGCGSGDSSGGGQPFEAAPAPTAELSVAVTFPSPAAESTTASVHVWAVASKSEAATSCPALIGGELDPYDRSLERRADVAVEPAKLPATATQVPLGFALVYVEAVSFEGTVELAGCVPIDVVEPSTSATVALTKAGVFDCGDPATEDGAPCDDGKLCTLGEKCNGGQCKGGVVRSCSHLADGCNAGSCDEDLGCTSTPLPDNNPCDDGLYCTEGDLCKAGVCVGQPRNCSDSGNPCQIAAGCDESTNQCVYSVAPYGTSCDDGNFCTVNDYCNYSGTCVGSQRDCSQVTDQCNNPGCDEATDACVPVPKSTIYTCNDTLGCTTNDRCNGLGQCTGTLKSCAYLDDQCNTGTCQEPAGTCVKTPVTDGTACDDGDPGTTGDQCSAGVCAGTS
jgi:hypothetical protein